MLVSWAHDPGGDWAAPLRGWVDGTGCDAWLLHYRTSDPVSHAAGWLRPLGEADAPAHAAALDRWLAYLRELGIDGPIQAEPVDDGRPQRTTTTDG